MMCCGSKSKILVYKKDDDLHFDLYSSNIADLYSSNFEQMYDSVGFDEDNMHLSKSRIYDPVINMCMHENYDNDDVHSCVVLIIFRNV